MYCEVNTYEVNTHEVCYKIHKKELNATDNGAQYAFRKLLETSPFNKFPGCQ